MKIYTKTGDAGETSIIEGKRIPKSELLIEANGALDEATSFIGWARETVEDDKARTLLSGVQHDLYEVMGFLAGATIPTKNLEKRIVTFEEFMDKQSAKLPPLHRFILPQGGEVTTRLHIARTIVRSAERRVVRFVREKLKYSHKAIKSGESAEFLMIRYLNRLSDVLFTLARTFAQVEKRT
ncbi:cob(I)yrinic acid a,c-diamide adenosyltransferase [Candidatus Woesebacteria bacterium]|nr:cob(I)yrinic acid a,c-diamide adenosyltransferase [Candidatus Woesebacteria bacterium]